MNESQMQMDAPPQSHSAESPKGWKAVYTIVDRPGADRRFWVRIGTAFVNRDQSLTVRLDASPTNGQLHLRDADTIASRRPPVEPLGGGGVS